MKREDVSEVRKIAAEFRVHLDTTAGQPEVADQYRPVPANLTLLSTDEVKAALKALPARIEPGIWWKIGLDPTRLERALREPASVISGLSGAIRAQVVPATAHLLLARQAGDFLIWTQEQAGTGLFPFPATRGATSDNAFVAAERFFARAEREGWISEVVRNGWAIDDRGDGGLQFDNGEAGVALLDLYRATRDRKYLTAALKAADWAVGRPCVPNWNYNSFSVWLLARAHLETQDSRYLKAALLKAQLGVLPGQMQDGPLAGRWADAHNARPAYHYIMMRALAVLASALPKKDPARPEIMKSLELGLKARNREMIERGVMNTNSALDALVVVERAFREDRVWLAETRTTAALEQLGKALSAEYRAGAMPVSPRPWSAFLTYLIERK